MPTEFIELPGVGRLERQSKPFDESYLVAIKGIQRRFSLEFEWLTIFDEDVLRRLFAPFDGGANVRVTIAEQEPIASAIATLEELANAKRTKKAQAKYVAALEVIGLANIKQIEDRFFRKKVCFVGIEREGAILATLLGLRPAPSFAKPQLKRIKYDKVLIVGACKLPATQNCDELVIIDGAIASGATIVSLLAHTKVKRVTIYSVHATQQGLNAITRFACAKGIIAEIFVGYVTDGLNAKFYAEANNRLVVGDLGDWIATLYPGY